MLRISDLNQIIKNYAYKMQQRMQELQHFRCYQFREDDFEQDGKSDAISRYIGCVSNDQKDVKLASKFKERLIQIYDFFKGKSNNQNILNAIQINIEQQLNTFISTESVRLGDMFAYVNLITKRGNIIKPTASQKRSILSRSTLKPQQKNSEKPPTYHLFNIQRRPSTSNKVVKTVSVERWRLSELADQLWGSLQFDKPHLLRIKEGNEELMLKEMLRRNEKIRTVIKQNQRRKTRLECSQQLKSSIILSEVKPNTMKGIWNTKKRASMIGPSKKNKSAKENLSFFA